MNRQYFRLFLFAGILSYIIGCAPWVDQLDRKKNENFYKQFTIYTENFSVYDFERLIDKLDNEAGAEFPKLKDPVVRAEGPKVPAEGTAKTEMVFVHISDVQIRDERVKLFGKNASKTLDNIISSFEHGIVQEQYDYAAYLALIKTINVLYGKTTGTVNEPKFVIHTGDAVDASVVEELYEFIYTSNKLQIPWFNVLGNHDVTVFGNFNNKKIYVNDPNLTFQTLHNKFNFINMHGEGHKVDPNINPGPLDAGQISIMWDTRSSYHGFDLYDAKKNRKYTFGGNFLCKYCPGYYSFKLRKTNGAYEFVTPMEENPSQNSQEIVFIVLNTTTIKLGFAQGTVAGDNQLEWLRNQFKENDGKLIFVFGHHPLDESNFLDESYKELIELFHQHHVVAYFCGHTHAYQIRFHKKKGTNQGFWEVITDSIIEYPQEGSLVTISNLGKGIGAIDVRSFGRNITNASQLKRESDSAFKDAKEDAYKKSHFKEIAEQDRNAKLTFSHPYFAD